MSRLELEEQNALPDNGSELWVMNADGSHARLLTTCRSSPAAPAWSPDGGSIAFERQRDEQTDVFLINPDGSGLRNLSNDPHEDWTPSWSPDGTSIVFSRASEGRSADLYVFVLATGKTRRLTTAHQNEISPDWAPPPP